MPAWIGLPGVSNPATLLTTSLRIGVGDSLRFLKNRSDIAVELLKAKNYEPNDLLFGLAPYLTDASYDIAGYHIYCFNQVERTEKWRHDFLGELNATHAEHSG